MSRLLRSMGVALALLAFLPGLALAQGINSPSATGRTGPRLPCYDLNGNLTNCIYPGEALVDGSGVQTGTTANPLIIGGGATATPPKSFRQTCTTSAVAFPSNVFSNGFVVSIVSGAGIAYLGPQATLTTANGQPISTGGTVPLAAFSYGLSNSNLLGLICSDAVTVVVVSGN